MSTVGTLYDETVKNGFAKLLSVQTFTGVYVCDFVAPLSSLEYRTFWFDIDNLIGSNTDQYLFMYTSHDGGATWNTTTNYWVILIGYSHTTTAFYGSVMAGAPAQAYLQPGGSVQYGPLPLAGRVYFYRSSVNEGGGKVFEWHITFRHPSYGMCCTWGGGGYYGHHGINGVRFQYNAGATMTGAIRCYGLKKGS